LSIEADSADQLGSGTSRTAHVPAVSDCLLAALTLLCAGVVYRVAYSHLDNLIGSPVSLPQPMKFIPRELEDWQGDDLSIPTTTQTYMQKNFADDFISRRYIENNGQAWADLYVVYCSSRPGGILGHRPRICYPAHGWIHDSTTQSYFVSKQGRKIPCLIHEFHKPAPELDQTVVLNFYVVNGHITTNEDDFSGAGWRRPNIAGDPAKYVAQIQISSATENNVRLLARDAADHVLDFLPDPNGNVAVVDVDWSTGENR